jgi:DNA-binding protein H-NS
MATNLATLEVPALLKLRDDVEARLASMKEMLAEQLAALGIGAPAKRGRKPGKPAHALKGTTRPAKYRDPATGKTWAGVGMTPLWIKEYEKAGKSRERFSTGVKVAASKAKKRPAKKSVRK